MGHLLELNYFVGLNKWFKNECFDLGLFLLINFNFNDSFDSIVAQFNWQWDEHILGIEFVLSIWTGRHLKDMIDSLQTLINAPNNQLNLTEHNDSTISAMANPAAQLS